MPRSSDDERDKLGKVRDKISRRRPALKAWKQTPPANNAQRDRMLDDHNEMLLAVVQRLNLLEGKVEAEDLIDPGS